MFSVRLANTVRVVLPVVLAFVLVVPIAAHHGWSKYEQDKPLKKTGVIKTMTYEHPHGEITLEVEGKAWKVVLAPPTRMENRGLTREMLAVGSSVTVEAYQHREIADELRAERITARGKTVELR